MTPTPEQAAEVVSEVRLAISTYEHLVRSSEEWLEHVEAADFSPEEISAQRMKARVLRMALSDLRGILGLLRHHETP